MTTLTQASRPADERFLSLTKLREKVADQRKRSKAHAAAAPLKAATHALLREELRL